MLKNRVLAGWIIAFTIGVGIGMYTDGKIRLIAFALIGVLCGLLLAAHRFCNINKFDVKKAATVCLLIIFGMTYSAAYAVYAFSGNAEYDRRTDIITARVLDIGSFSDGGYLDISVTESRIGLGSGTKVRLYYTENDTEDNVETKIKRGDTVTCTVLYKAHRSNSMYSKSIYLTAQGSIDDRTAGSGILYSIRESTEKTTEDMFRRYPTEVGEIARTLITGEKTDAEPYTYALFRNAGISHLLVISGLHISIIVMSLFGFLELLTVRRQIRSIICLLVLLGYAFFVGFTPSVSRAVIMTGIMFVTMLATRRADSITSLFIALFVLLLINPFALFSVGLGLSFLSCLGILIVSPHLLRPIKGRAKKTKNLLRIILSPLLFSCAATVFSFPVLLIGFDTVSYISPLINLIITPLFAYLLIIMFPCVLLFSFLGTGAGILSFIPGQGISLLYGLLKRLFESEIGSFSTHIPYIAVPAALAVTVIASVCVLRRKSMYIAAGALTVCFIASLAFCIISNDIKKEDTSFVVLNDSFAYKSLFIADGNECLYIELGGKKSGISTVYKHGYRSLDYYVMNGLTRSDFVKLESALAQINISAIYIPEVKVEQTELYYKIKMLANTRDCDIIEYDTIIFENIGYSMVTVRSSDELDLADSFIAVLEKSGKSIRVYGGERIPYSNEYGYSDVVISLRSFTEPYEDIYCSYRCMRVMGKDDEARYNAEGEFLYDYSITDYVRVTFRNKLTEVNLSEP
ncbi:MAG: hypothetical protein CVU97_05335 [Firmicutes bacterium HGW-Firmicutes-21]|nr:MAG: hypothetical protein CVU97_05335 [Firmicutes bacterium HGW-Firmicutes-21]